MNWVCLIFLQNCEVAISASTSAIQVHSHTPTKGSCHITHVPLFWDASILKALQVEGAT